MIHTILFLPGLTAGGLSLGGGGGKAEPLNVEAGLAVDAPLVTLPRMSLQFFGGVHEELGVGSAKGVQFGVSATELSAEVGPQWHFGHAPLTASCDFGFGVHDAVVVPGGQALANAMGFGTHTQLTTELGSGPVRLALSVRVSGTFSQDYLSGSGYLPTGRVQWSYAGVNVRVNAGVGLAFGKTQESKP